MQSAPGGPGREAGPYLSPARDQDRFSAAPTPLGETAVRAPVGTTPPLPSGSTANAASGADRYMVGPVVYAPIEPWLSERSGGRPSSRRRVIPGNDEVPSARTG